MLLDDAPCRTGERDKGSDGVPTAVQARGKMNNAPLFSRSEEAEKRGLISSDVTSMSVIQANVQRSRHESHERVAAGDLLG
jgi:hypothetical protein